MATTVMQNLFVRYLEPDRVALVVATFRPEAAKFARPRGWPTGPSYPTTVAISPLRREVDAGPDFPRYWASRFSDGGRLLEFEWILLVDEHNRIDCRLAGHLSRELDTTCLAVHASEGTDEYGWGWYRRGALASQYFREMEERPVYRVNEELEHQRIPHKIRRYRDCSGPGWQQQTIG